MPISSVRASDLARCWSELESRVLKSGDDVASRLEARFEEVSADVLDAAAVSAADKFFDSFPARSESRTSATKIVVENGIDHVFGVDLLPPEITQLLPLLGT
jgi:hypothetical protein